ncbi:MAG: COG4705 family protein [Acidimicrobiales bacterium]
MPELTAYFWIVKVLTTALGEAISDYLVHTINPYLAVTLGGVGLAASLLLQFTVRRYIAWVYWLAVVMVAVFGTMAADVLHIQFGVPYAASAVLFALALAVVFMVWHARERTLSIHSISTRRRELFYWAAVLAAFALGTATGDLTALTMHLGYFASGLLFAAVFALPALAYWRAGMNAIFAFWFAYIATRPLGASFADWMGKPTVPVGSGGAMGPSAWG